MAEWWEKYPVADGGGTATMEPPAQPAVADQGNWWEKFPTAEQEPLAQNSQILPESIPLPALPPAEVSPYRDLSQPATPMVPDAIAASHAKIAADEAFLQTDPATWQPQDWIRYHESLPMPITADAAASPELRAKYARVNELVTGEPYRGEGGRSVQEIASDRARMNNAGFDDPVAYIQQEEAAQQAGGNIASRTAGAFAGGLVQGTEHTAQSLLGHHGQVRTAQLEQSWQEGIEQLKDADSWLPFATKMARKTGETMGRMTPSLVAAAATKNPTAAYWMLGGQAGVDAFGDVRSRGWSWSGAALYGAAAGAIETASEFIGGKLATKLGLTTAEEAFAAGLKGNTGRTIFTEAIKNPTLRKVVEGIAGSVMEGGEELLADVMHSVKDTVFRAQQQGGNPFETFMIGMLAGGAAHIPAIAAFAINPTLEALKAAKIPQSVAPNQEAREKLAAAINEAIATPVEEGEAPVPAEAETPPPVDETPIPVDETIPPDGETTPEPAAPDGPGIQEALTEAFGGQIDLMYDAWQQSLEQTGEMPGPERDANTLPNQLWTLAKQVGVTPEQFVSTLRTVQPSTPADYAQIAKSWQQLATEPAAEPPSTPEPTPTPEAVAGPPPPATATTPAAPVGEGVGEGASLVQQRADELYQSELDRVSQTDWYKRLSPEQQEKANADARNNANYIIQKVADLVANRDVAGLYRWWKSIRMPAGEKFFKELTGEKFGKTDKDMRAAIGRFLGGTTFEDYIAERNAERETEREKEAAASAERARNAVLDEGVRAAPPDGGTVAPTTFRKLIDQYVAAGWRAVEGVRGKFRTADLLSPDGNRRIELRKKHHIDYAIEKSEANADPDVARIEQLLRRAAPKAKAFVAKRDQGGFTIEFENGAKVDLLEVGKIEASDKVLSKALKDYGLEDTPENRERFGRNIRGRFDLRTRSGRVFNGPSLIQMRDDLDADVAAGVLRHELVHFARSTGLIDDAEWLALVDKYAGGKTSEMGQQEAIARMVQGEPGLIKRIRDWLDSLLDAMGVQVDDYKKAEKAVRTGKVLARPPKAKPESKPAEAPPKEAAAAEPKVAPAPEPKLESTAEAQSNAEQDEKRPRRTRSQDRKDLAPDQAEPGEKTGARRDAVRGDRGDGAGSVADARDAVPAGDGSESSGRDLDDGAGEPAGRDESVAAEPPGGNYRITDADQIGQGGPKAKYRGNADAIRLLKTLEAEGRKATAAEQATLAKYVGWGALINAFPSPSGKIAKGWHGEVAELRELLTDEEYDAAKKSTRNAHYTSPSIIAGIWKALETGGFTGGVVNEPGMGVGHFFGLMPESIRDASQLHGVEMDSITGRIAKQLYQDAKIVVAPFQEVRLPDNHFDLMISNVPFAKGRTTDTIDRDLGKLGASIHDYYFAKALKKTRPGGLVVFITSRFSLDKVDSGMRQYWADRADFLGAVRLPSNAFKENAGTDVVTDVIVLQKRPEGATPAGQAFVDTKKVDLGGKEYAVNEYFVDHPKHVLGNLTTSGTMYAEDSLNVEADGRDVAADLADILGSLKYGDLSPANINTDAIVDAAIEAHGEDGPDGGLVVKGGKLYRREGDNLVEQPIPFGERGKEKTLARIHEAGKLREATRALLAHQINPGATDERVDVARTRLNEIYDAFVKEYGALNSARNVSILGGDDFAPLLRSLETWDEEAKKAVKADIFTKRTQFPVKEIERADTAGEALTASLSLRGRVDLEWMRGIYPTESADKLVDELGDRVYRTPDGRIDTAENYLSGNVRKKLAEAKEAAKQDKAYGRNVAALEKVQPEDVPFDKISPRLGVTWVSPKDYSDFVEHLISKEVRFQYSTASGTWVLTNEGSPRLTEKERVDWGTDAYPTLRLLEAEMNHRHIQVTHKDSEGNTIVDKDASAAARAKRDELAREFDRWLWTDPKRAERLSRTYNDNFNNIRLPEYDGSHLNFPGMSSTIRLRPHQANAIWRILSTGNTLLAHVVGAGKTFTMQAAAMEMRRLGIAKKPMFVVPNHLIQQFPSEFLQLYPGARLLAATPDDFTPANRQRLMNRIMTGDWDGIVVPQTSFEKVPVSPARMKAFFDAQIADLEKEIREAKAEKGTDNRNYLKELENAKDNLEAKLKELSADWKKDSGPFFDELGVDALFVDEAHGYKNLWFRTRMGRVPGVQPQFVQKTFDMLQKTEYMNEVTGGRGVVFATGTPVANSVTELYTMQRYLQPKELAARGIEAFDAWASTFGREVTDVEVTPEGGGFRVHTRFRQFVNLPELQQMFRSVADVMMAAKLKLPRPTIKGGKAQVIQGPTTPELEGIVKGLVERAEKIRSGQVDPTQDNMLAVTNDGRSAAVDLRLFDPSLPDFPDSKLNQAVENVYGIWKRTAGKKSTQIIWLDRGIPSDKTKAGQAVDLYSDIKQKLIALGVPEGDIAFIHDAKNDKQRANLFKKMRSGQVRIMIANTERMATGANVQKRLIAAHHLDAPWRPADVEQRDGRIVRQGNENSEVEIYRYVTKGSFDAYMWQTLEMKAQAISQLMDGDGMAREMEDVGGAALEYAEIKAIAARDPRIMRFTKLRAEVSQLEAERGAHNSQQVRLRMELGTQEDIERSSKEKAKNLGEYAGKAIVQEGGEFDIKVKGKSYERKDAAEPLQKAIDKIPLDGDPESVGEFSGFPLLATRVHNWASEKRDDTVVKATLVGPDIHFELGQDGVGNLLRIANQIKKIPDLVPYYEQEAEKAALRQKSITERVGKPFAKQAELDAKAKEMAELSAALSKPAEQEKPEEGGEDDPALEVDQDGERQEFHAGIPIPPALRQAFNRITSTLGKAATFHDYRRALLNRGAEQQKLAQDIEVMAKQITENVPEAKSRAGITNWIQAAGDKTVLAARAAASKGDLKAGYEAALHLTPADLAVAQTIRDAYEKTRQLAISYGIEIAELPNYVNQVWRRAPLREFVARSNKRLDTSVRFAKERFHDSFFDGEQAGLVPATKDVSKLLAMYVQEVRTAIINKRFVASLYKGKAMDGRPLLAPTGAVQVVQNPGGDSAYFVLPKAPTAETTDYKSLDQPALSSWRWKSEDENGNPIFVKGDLRVHPEIYPRLKNVLGISALREWWSSASEHPIDDIPKLVAKFLVDDVQQAGKQTLLGFLSPFHQVQEATHAIGHRVNPFAKLPKIDLKDPKQMDAAKHGLMLHPDRASATLFSEGLTGGTKNIVANVIGAVGGKPGRWFKERVLDAYQHYLFHQYIPALKYKTYEHMLKRNRKRFAKELAAGTIEQQQLKYLSAQQSNAAYGHLNYADMARNPTMQHLAQTFLLAPDFLEARGRFAGQAALGVARKEHWEQLAAIGFLALLQFSIAKILSKVFDDDWHWDHPFEVIVGNRRYRMRSVPEDIYMAVKDSRQFITGRLSPLVGRGLLEGLSGVNWRGEPTTAKETFANLLANLVPLTLQPLTRGLSQEGRYNTISPYEQFLGSLGIPVSRYNPTSRVYELAHEWVDENAAEYGIDNDKSVYPISKYQQLRYALEDRDDERAKAEFNRLLAEEKVDELELRQRILQSLGRPFTGSTKTDKAFRASLEPNDQALFDAAVERRKAAASRIDSFLSPAAMRARATPTAKLAILSFNYPEQKKDEDDEVYAARLAEFEQDRDDAKAWLEENKSNPAVMAAINDVLTSKAYLNLAPPRSTGVFSPTKEGKISAAKLKWARDARAKLVPAGG